VTGSSGQLEATGGHTTWIRADPASVYDALTTGEGLDSWFTSGSEVDPRPGGYIHLRWKNWSSERFTGDDRGPVLEADPPRRFVFQWHPDGDEYATTVEIGLRPDAGGTMVTVEEHGFRNTRSGLQELAATSAGWGEALTILKYRLEHGLRADFGPAPS
jgi:uncharacterized protein YndB with AHSA1/START domain